VPVDSNHWGIDRRRFGSSRQDEKSNGINDDFPALSALRSMRKLKGRRKTSLWVGAKKKVEVGGGFNGGGGKKGRWQKGGGAPPIIKSIQKR